MNQCVGESIIPSRSAHTLASPSNEAGSGGPSALAPHGPPQASWSRGGGIVADASFEANNST